MVIGSEDADCTAVPGDSVHDQAEGRALAGTVFSGQPQDAALWERQIEILQGKTGINLV